MSRRSAAAKKEPESACQTAIARMALMCDFTPREMKAIGEDIAQKFGELIEKQAKAKDLKAEIGNLNAELAKLGKQLADKREQRQVKVEFRLDDGKLSAKRTDTGEVLNVSEIPYYVQWELPGAIKEAFIEQRDPGAESDDDTPADDEDDT